jgi:membrane fusion protein (multidrug efflux system)
MVLAGCGRGPEQKSPPAVPVSVMTVGEGPSTFYLDFPGTVTALNQVDVRAQVSGYVSAIYFEEGKHVAKGTKLYAIDERQYRAAFDQASANLNVARANLAKVQQDADRYQELAKEDAVARQTLEHAQADLQASKMQVVAAEAAVKTAETNLHYAIIEAPFDCSVGISQVRVGSAVVAGQTQMTTLSSDNPIAVEASIDEKQIGRFVGLLDSKRAEGDSTFMMLLPDKSKYPHSGHLNLIDRAVDPQTGTIKVRVSFPNPARLLRPGMSCNLLVRSASSVKSILVPSKAVVEQMGEFFVYVVIDGKASQRKVSLGMRIQDKYIVNAGINSGDIVVTEGVQKLRDNIPVAVPQSPQAAASATPSTPAQSSR